VMWLITYWHVVQHLGDSCKVLEEIANGKHPFAKVTINNSNFIV